MVMSWKGLLLISLIVCVAVVACLARHFLGDVLFLVEHVIATGVSYSPALLQFFAALVR
jgi:hypothetical protein